MIMGHLLRLMAMTDEGYRYPHGCLFMEDQGSEIKDLETLAKNTWRNKFGDTRDSGTLPLNPLGPL